MGNFFKKKSKINDDVNQVYIPYTANGGRQVQILKSGAQLHHTHAARVDHLYTMTHSFTGRHIIFCSLRIDTWFQHRHPRRNHIRDLSEANRYMDAHY